MQDVCSPGASVSSLIAQGLWLVAFNAANELVNNFIARPLQSASQDKVQLVLKEQCFKTLLQQDVAFTEQEAIMGGEGGVEGMNELLHHATGTISDFMTNKFPDLLSSLSELASALGMLIHFCPSMLFHFWSLAIFRVEIYVYLCNF